VQPILFLLFKTPVYLDKGNLLKFRSVESAKGHFSKKEEVFHGGLPSQYHAFQRILDQVPICTIKVAYEVGP
jgi:hypothetical protein